MTNEQNVSGIENAKEFSEEMTKIREVIRSGTIELTNDHFSTGFVLLDHPSTQIHMATPLGQGLTNCILFSDENTEKQMAIQLNSTSAVVKYLIPLFIVAEMVKKMMETGEGNFSPYEIGLIDKLLEMKLRLVEKDVLSLTL
ncbi:hypothetical protein ACOMCU_01165 [Lysinibacillus sp. UGB7]|uniref:hypothetical protein n=1 Tax=Lysinibacillus sp. UGB7 TaxID=3411039 RepID=UPI003B7C52D3